MAYHKDTFCLVVLGAAFFAMDPGLQRKFIPVGREWSASVSDAAVSSLPVARDLFLNGTLVRVETSATGGESAVFRIDARGRVS
jgi:hypothetical protein